MRSAYSAVLCLLLTGAVSVFQFGYVPSACAEDSVKVVDPLKAAMLFNIARYVKWPDSASSFGGKRILFGLIGDVSFQKSLKLITSRRTVGGKKLRMVEFETLNDVEPVHVLYFGKRNLDEIRTVLKKVSDKPVLTVGEGREFVEQGGMIGFVKVNNQIRFFVNKRAAQNSDLLVSPNLLRLAEDVLE